MTFSIVARDAETDAVGVAVHSKFVAVGSVVPFADADAGAIATQSYANVAYGPDGLDMLAEGHDAATVVDRLTAADDDAPLRQVGVVGQDGSIAAFTGEECLDVAGDRQGEHYTVQGNILENEDTLDAMADAYEEHDGGLPERLLAALHAGNEAGGDSRGEQGAAMYVVKPDGGYDGRNDRWIDVRVDDWAAPRAASSSRGEGTEPRDSRGPIAELERVFKLYDVTLLERESPKETRELDGETARAVAATLADLGFYEGEPTETFGEDERAALEAFRGVNNFENHDLAVIEDAIARGWDDVDAGSENGEADDEGREGDGRDDDGREGDGRDDEGREGEGREGEQHLIDALWQGLSRLDRK